MNAGGAGQRRGGGGLNRGHKVTLYVVQNSSNLAWPVGPSVAYLAEVANIIESGKAVLGADRR